MTPEHSSLLGYLFIVGGIAIAILAYVISLNLREDRTEKVPERKGEVFEKEEGDASFEQGVSFQDAPMIESPLSSTSMEEPILTEEILVDVPEKKITGVDMPQEQELVSVVTILRELDSGNLILRIGEKNYTDFEALSDSPHLSRILRLSTDLEQWLKPSQVTERSSSRAPRPSKAIETEPLQSRSMVDEINEILERRLKTEPGKRKAIKLVEMQDGGVNVYIGVDSYSIDEVPFEDVRVLIREAVSEWEQRR
jgi:hypothetical protein